MTKFNTLPEYRNGFLVSAERKKVWKIEKDMLCLVLAICKKYDLRIWGDSGTLLGAVRHKGFIPWDDDIDLVMLREDYDKLLRIAPEEFCPPYFFQTIDTDSNYHRIHAQIRHSDSTAILPEDIYEDFNQGIFIDIFPLNAVPGQGTDNNTLKDTVQCKERLFWGYRNVSWWHFLIHPFAFFYHVKNKIFFLKYPIKQQYLDLENEMRKFPTGLANEVSYRGSFSIKKEWIADTIYMPFEDIEIPVPVGYKQILTMYYGTTYMCPVHSPTLHGSVIFDPDIPYKQALTILRKEHSIPRMLLRFFKRIFDLRLKPLYEERHLKI